MLPSLMTIDIARASATGSETPIIDILFVLHYNWRNVTDSYKVLMARLMATLSTSPILYIRSSLAGFKLLYDFV